MSEEQVGQWYRCSFVFFFCLWWWWWWNFEFVIIIFGYYPYYYYFYYFNFILNMMKNGTYQPVRCYLKATVPELDLEGVWRMVAQLVRRINKMYMHRVLFNCKCIFWQLFWMETGEWANKGEGGIPIIWFERMEYAEINGQDELNCFTEWWNLQRNHEKGIINLFNLFFYLFFSVFSVNVKPRSN